jgi:hypothetical protein
LKDSAEESEGERQKERAESKKGNQPENEGIRTGFLNKKRANFGILGYSQYS